MYGSNEKLISTNTEICKYVNGVLFCAAYANIHFLLTTHKS